MRRRGAVAVDELVDQILAGGVDLDPVHARCNGVARGLGTIGDDLPNALDRQLLRRGNVGPSVICGLLKVLPGLVMSAWAVAWYRLRSAGKPCVVA